MDEAQCSLVDVSRSSEKRITPILVVKEEVLLAEVVFGSCS
jgi:hypothetical protein